MATTKTFHAIQTSPVIQTLSAILPVIYELRYITA